MTRNCDIHIGASRLLATDAQRSLDRSLRIGVVTFGTQQCAEVVLRAVDVGTRAIPPLHVKADRHEQLTDNDTSPLITAELVPDNARLATLPCVTKRDGAL